MNERGGIHIRREPSIPGVYVKNLVRGGSSLLAIATYFTSLYSISRSFRNPYALCADKVSTQI